MYDEPCPGWLLPFLQFPLRFPRVIHFMFSYHRFFPPWFPWWCHEFLFLMISWCHNASYYLGHIYNTIRSLWYDPFVRDATLLVEICYSLFPWPFSSTSSIFPVIWDYFHILSIALNLILLCLVWGPNPFCTWLCPSTLFHSI